MAMSGMNLNFSSPSSVGQGVRAGSGNPFSGMQAGNIGNLLYGLFGDAGAPYEAAGSELDKYFPQAQQYQQPFYDAGTGAIPQYQKWLQGMQDPSKFMNNLMGQYQESPYAQNLQRQSRQAGMNAASASGLTGSTPFAQQMQQNAGNIASGDMNQWLQNVLGVNSQYGAGQAGMMEMGQHSADSLTNMIKEYMNNKANLAYNQENASQGQTGSLFSGLAGLAGLFL